MLRRTHTHKFVGPGNGGIPSDDRCGTGLKIDLTPPNGWIPCGVPLNQPQKVLAGG